MEKEHKPTWLRGRARTALLAAAGGVVVIAASVAVLPDAGASVPATPAGWTQIFADDFNGAAGTGVNTGNWLYDLGHGYPGGAGNWGTGEIENMTNSTANVYQDGAGNLAIKPIRDGAGNWTSGRIETQRTDLTAPAGGKLRLEARLQQPNVNTGNGAGYWPAFWALGAAARGTGASGWPGIGEIDIMEDINGRSSEFGTLHCGTSPGGPCNETTGIGSGERACSGCQTGFHTYAVEQDRSTSPEQIRWYLDGNNFFTVNANQVDATTWNNATHHGFFIILNVAIGGGFPDAFGGGPNGSTISGQPMLVDYVTAYTSGGGTTSAPPTAGTITGPGGKCVDVAGDDTGGNGTAVQLWDCQSYAVDQHWTHNADNSLSTLGRCLDINGNGTANGTQVELWDCNGVGGQKWVQQADGSLRNPQSGRCLDSPSGATANGTRLQIWDCNGTAAQKFAANGGGTILGPAGKCVDVAGDDNGSNGTAVQLWDCQSYAVDQHWYHNANGSLRTLGRCLDIIGNGTAQGTQVELWDCNGVGGQNWVQQADGSLKNPQSGRCLDSPSGATGNGTRLQIWDCNGTAAQKFALS
ncbi:ricin-type beta-trefoil lectin domain protein [Dactylosporangium sp. CA-139066]|uniref:ricin-type beta-trefoil lectin domain protein n=1 Tax=Dactylosporangium sp. CA-139066 TaxID=3239930 RepID=UPI003D8D9E54